jgi:predicted nuclease of predicted toxin-antitoxin system
MPPCLASRAAPNALRGVARAIKENASTRALGLRDAADAVIFQAAQQQGVVLISKDSEFVELLSRYGPPPQLIWVTCGNVTNRQLQTVFDKTFAESLELLSAEQAMVEIG